MNEEVVRFSEMTYRPILEGCQNFLYFVRGIEFQIEAVNKLEQLIKEVMTIKAHMIENQDEDAANCCLSLEMVAKALIHEIKMWISLKEDRTGDAWDELISAETAADMAISAHPISNNMIDYIFRLKEFEKILFPKVIFLSPGYVILSSRCSICGNEYGTCDHLKGLPYMGQICVDEITDTQIAEVSIVATPANRHCRIYKMKVDGAMRDIFTWRVMEFHNNDGQKESK